jgi:hypothetical protein
MVAGVQYTVDGVARACGVKPKVTSAITGIRFLM